MTTNPDNTAHDLLYLATMMSGAGFAADPADVTLLRQAAALISEQSEAIGVLHTEHAATLARLAEGEALLSQGVEIYDRQKAEIAQLQTENERLMKIILEAREQ